MKFINLYTFLGLLTTTTTSSIVNASRSKFYGDNDNRPKLFKILDDHVGTIKINLDHEIWTTMKKKTELEPWNAQVKGEKYGTNNATLEFFIKDQGGNSTENYKVILPPGKFNFQLGGKGSRNYSKPGYNIKLINESLYDVQVLRLRSNIRDNSSMREKLSSDMIYQLGIPTTSTNYVNVEVNGEDLGLYILTNKIRKDFIQRYFGDENTSNLYECKNDGTRFEDMSIGNFCENAKDELIDKKEDIQSFNQAINQAKSMEDIAKILDIDNFLKLIAFEFLTISWDHFLGYSHNYFWYKRKEDNKWMMLLNDFDETWGQDYSATLFFFFNEFSDKSYLPTPEKINISNLSIRDMDLDHKLLKYLIYDDDTHFRKILGEIVKKVFNPKVLFQRIDDIADLIREDVINSRTFDPSTGYAKGCFNILGFDPKWNITQWEDGINYGNWNSNRSLTTSYGLKFFIEERFKYICHTYGIDPETLELIEPRPKVSFWGIKNKYKASISGKDFYNDEFIKFSYPNLGKEDYQKDSYNANPEKNNKPTNYEIPKFRYELGKKYKPTSIVKLIGQFFDLNRVQSLSSSLKKLITHLLKNANKK
ncbi:coth-domain-containing protein [Anaeromyces robustus]|uniref:Coth-domain-containing protein n=1 Tax=Anaeromyces robustus TaxID=1754192 RepID=A0A1Y1XBC6_9FUNG|nr:coth-domain-containing protein [Anaeromyces robustus]|eukprot:ORX83032.1 coth-domain-containing protein [Anaeromyces robustus]